MKAMNKIRLVCCMIVCCIGGSQAQAQSVGDIFSGVVKQVSQKMGLEKDSASLVGTWKFAEPECRLKSDNLLADLGSGVAEAKMKTEIAKVLAKIGYKPGTTYVFKADSTYTMTVDGKTTSGKYTYDTVKKVLKLKTKYGFSLSPQIPDGVGKKKVVFLFNADKLLSLIQTASRLQAKVGGGVENKVIDTVLKQYDGMQLGVKMERIKP